MNILKLLLGKKRYNDYVYKHTEKPKEYVHLDEPKTLQEHRQVQYNNWCKKNGVYNGSYLPESPDTLTKKGKGWVETKGKPDKTVRNFTRKSSGQKVQFNGDRINNKGKLEDKHYHWKNIDKNGKEIKGHERFDRYGKPCEDGSPESHLAPLDKKYNMK